MNKIKTRKPSFFKAYEFFVVSPTGVEMYLYLNLVNYKKLPQISIIARFTLYIKKHKS